MLDIIVLTTSHVYKHALENAFLLLDRDLSVAIKVAHKYPKAQTDKLVIFHSGNIGQGLSSRNSRELLIEGQTTAQEIAHAIGLALFEFNYSKMKFSKNRYIVQENVL